jgi:hypothetical protein
VSDTPRTDAEAYYPAVLAEPDHYDVNGTSVDASFARELERENAALRHSEENLASTVRGLEFENEKLQRENAALREALDAARKEGGAT